MSTTDPGLAIDSPFIRETSIGGHIVLVPVHDVCEKCGQEKTNVMLYGEVCVHCDTPPKPI